MSAPAKTPAALQALAVTLSEAMAVLARELGSSAAAHSFPRAVVGAQGASSPEAPPGRVLQFPAVRDGRNGAA